MPTPDTMTDAERHRQAAEATERHSKHHHEPKHDSSGGSAYGASVHSGDVQEDNEASFFIRHRSKLAAGFLIVLSIIFFTFVFGLIRL